MCIQKKRAYNKILEAPATIPKFLALMTRESIELRKTTFTVNRTWLSDMVRSTSDIVDKT